jgi:C-terminal processing protease CtpA/Prc
MKLTLRIYLLVWAVLFLGACNTYSQKWDIRAYETERRLVVDLVSTIPNELKKPGYCFFGPNQSATEAVIRMGYEPLKLISITNGPDELKGQFLGSEIILPKETMINLSTGQLYLNLYCENISFYRVYFQIGGKWYSREWEVSAEKYQVPNEIAISEWKLQLDATVRQSDDLPIDRMLITAKVAVPEKPFQFALGELRLIERFPRIVPAKGYFFYDLTKDTLNKQEPFEIKFGDNFPISNFSVFRNFYSQYYLFRQENVDKEKYQNNTLELIKFIIDHYSFYAEHHINKQKTMLGVQNIVSSSLSFENKIDSLSKKVSSFFDGHFYFESVPLGLKPGPILVKEINGEIQVVAVFDEELKNKVALGSVVKKIDGVEVDKVLKNKQGRYYGSETDRRSQAVSQLLSKDRNDSTQLTVSKNNKLTSVTYGYNKAFKIPSNFKPQHREFKTVNDCSYFRLNRWDAGDWISFYNHADQIKKDKGLIIDLRGNTGGAEVEAYQILSCFVNKPTVVSYNSYSHANGVNIKRSNVVVPNKYLDLYGKRVVLLVDNKTACASEIFIAAMKSNPNITIVGSERTSGSYSSGVLFDLPFDIKIRTNVLDKFYPPNDKYFIEYKGIAPDKMVKIGYYSDLYPYDDKVLQFALKLVESN